MQNYHKSIAIESLGHRLPFAHEITRYMTFFINKSCEKKILIFLCNKKYMSTFVTQISYVLLTGN